jgi:hypothetical protein
MRPAMPRCGAAIDTNVTGCSPATSPAARDTLRGGAPPTSFSVFSVSAHTVRAETILV